MKYVLLILILCSVSCGRHSAMQLPEAGHTNIRALHDLASVSVYYNANEKDSVELEATHPDISKPWQLKVDRRLTLRQAIPAVQTLQAKKRQDGTGDGETSKTYFVFRNTASKHLGHLDFSKVVYHYGIDKSIVENHGLYDFQQLNGTNHVLSILFNEHDSVAINSAKYAKSEFMDRLVFMDSIQHQMMGIVYLKFNENLSFQEYIAYKSMLSEIKLEHATISKDEYIFR